MQFNDRLNNNYDFLRVLAAVCITFTHSYNLLSKNNDEPLMKITGGHYDFSFIGLSIFFSISGYLIAKSAFTSPSFKNYIWKRFLRIQPLLIVVCIVSVFIIAPFFSSLSPTDFFKEKSSFTYFRNIMPVFGIQFSLPGVFSNNPAESGINGSLWTLIVEERLYLIIGVLFFFKKFGRLFLLILIGVLNLAYFTSSAFYTEKLIRYFTGQQVFYGIMFLNASCYYLLNIYIEKSSKLYLYLASIPFFLLLSQFVIFEKSLQIILIPLFVLAVAQVKCLTNKAGKFGDFTYGIYIFSFPVQQMLIASSFFNDDPVKLFIFTLLLVSPLAILSWHLLEKKLLLQKGFVV